MGDRFRSEMSLWDRREFSAASGRIIEEFRASVRCSLVSCMLRPAACTGMLLCSRYGTHGSWVVLH
eukprot:375785-Rhodomonas_salina.3